MQSVFKEPLTEKSLEEYVALAKDFIISHGVIHRNRSDPSCLDTAMHAPFALFPTPIPRHCFRNADDVQADFNLVMHRIPYDRDFLEESLKSVVKVDDFTKRIWDIYETVHHEGSKQPVSLALNRSDYMIKYNPTSSLEDWHNTILQQVEFNTVAVGPPGLCQRLYYYHKYILEQYGLGDKVHHIPVNKAADGLAEGLITAWNCYGNPKAIVMFLIYGVERNIYDQRMLEYLIAAKDDRIKMIRRSLNEVMVSAHLSADNRLFVDGMEVAIVYQRSCYDPKDFISEDSWRYRLMIERSRAILCPSAGTHLAGTKKIQQIISEPGVLERFTDDTKAIERMRATFAPLYGLEMNERGDESVAMAIKDPSHFVLKPQREGGGNNIYGEELQALMTKLKDSDERAAYILMEKINPIVSVNYPVSPGKEVLLTNVVSELGIFGTLVGTKEMIFLNKPSGYLMRSKKVGIDEGGIIIGLSVLDSPFLID